MRSEKSVTLMLDTPEGMMDCPAVHRQKFYGDQLRRVMVAVTVGENEYIGLGVDTEYALYDLATRLTQGCTLRCCLSCRHGHFCPVGDADNELFCVTDFEPKAKSDLYHVTEDEQERAARSRTLFHVCEGWQPQSDEYYTYSEYLDRMKRGRTNETHPDLPEA